MEEESGEERAERKVWSECSLCKREYSYTTTADDDDAAAADIIRMNGECLHSYCKECIEKNATSSQLCPVCSKPLSSPLSSLPINYSLLYWCSLSPPLLQNNNNNINNNNNNKNTNVKIDLCKLNNNLSNKRIKLEVEKECSLSPFSHTYQKVCEECGENKAELHCKECKSYLCSLCSKQVHNLKIMKNHSISLYDAENDISSKNNQSKCFTNYFICDLHHQKEKELYCETCEQCVCVYCIDNHKLHTIISVTNKVADIQSQWLNDAKQISDKQYQNLISRENIILKQVKEIDEEIGPLEAKLKILKEKRSSMEIILNDIIDSKSKVNLTLSFLSSFLHSLPPLPLSSFIPFSSNSNNNNRMNNNNFLDDKIDDIINDDNDNIKKSKRIKDFFEMKNLKDLFSSLQPLHRADPLILNNNLIFQSNNRHKFNKPLYISYNDKLNMMAISDFIVNKVKIMDKKGALIRSFPIERPLGIAIIPSLNLLAVSSGDKQVIKMFDISPLLPIPPNNKKTSHIRHHDDPSLPLPLLYTIRKLSGPMGIGYSEGKGILAISDSGNKRIEIYKIRRDGYDHHSFISLLSNPHRIAISSPGDLILFSAHTIGKGNCLVYTIYIYKEGREESNRRVKKKKILWREEGEIRAPPSLQPPLISPSGIAIHSPLNYCVICDGNNHRILFFNITTRDLICSYQPTLPPPSSSLYFHSLSGISIDEEANLISVSDVGSHSISLFRSPII